MNLQQQQPQSPPPAIEAGAILACAHCARDLTVRDVESDRAFCERNGFLTPSDEELLCRRKACRQLRKGQAAQLKKKKDENHFVAGKEVRSIEADDAVIFTGTRRDQDGHVRPEKPLVDLALTKYDLMDDEGKLRRPSRPDQEILQSLLDKPLAEPRCELHGTPGCGPCRSLREAYENAAKHPGDQTPSTLASTSPSSPAKS